jgi:hypothetical protein
MSGNCVNVNLNFNDSIVNTSANVLIIGYFVYLTGKYIIDKFEIDVVDLIHKITNKIVNDPPEEPLKKIKKDT